MKGLWSWMKAHIAVVALSAVILLSLPSAFAVSGVLNRGLRKAREAEVNKDYKDLEAGVTYVIPPVTPDGAPVEHRAQAPNDTITKWFKEQREARGAQVGEVVRLATEMNRGDHGVMLEGIFPAPSEGESVFKRLEFVDLLVGKDGNPSVYQALFDAIQAGGPPDPVVLREELDELLQRELDRHKAEFGDAQPTPEQRRAMLDKLVGQRLGAYQRRASEISVYATMDCLPPHGIRLPRKPFRNVDENAPLAQCFEWQWDYWVFADLLRAVGAANTDADGEWTPVERSVVKRIEKMRVEELPIFGDRTLANDAWTPAGGGSEKAPLDPTHSITGRRSSKHNTQYDVRVADLEVLVDSARLADLINAISRTNFMTVIECELREADPWKDLRDGYYYGDTHVMKARLKIETVWLRSWTEPLMPEVIKAPLGIATEGAETAGAPAAAPAPAPVRRAAPRDLGDEGEATGRGRRRGGGGGGGGG